jgi:ribosomal protein S18 acetylase RimI-like enzyme
MASGEEAEVSDMIACVFNEFVAPEYPPKGIEEFSDYIQPQVLRERADQGHFILLAKHEGKIVGMIEMRGGDHVSLWFVDKRFQGRGIGRQLWTQALAWSRRHWPGVKEITVNSSSYAVKIYERLGFEPRGPQEIANWISFYPMVLRLE